MATSVEEAAYVFFRAQSALVTALGAIYWHKAPHGTEPPYSVFYQVDDPRVKTYLHVYGGEARLRFDIFNADAAKAVTGAQTLIETAREFRGLHSGLVVSNAEVVNVLTQPRTTDDITHRTVDIIVKYTEG